MVKQFSENVSDKQKNSALGSEGCNPLEGGGSQLEQWLHRTRRDTSSEKVITSFIRRSLATFSLSHSSSLFSHTFLASSLKEKERIISKVTTDS